eukprot:6504984-Alexandrium_andersonii.AAC.1
MAPHATVAARHGSAAGMGTAGTISKWQSSAARAKLAEGWVSGRAGDSLSLIHISEPTRLALI